jgi:hypothetical protein
VQARQVAHDQSFGVDPSRFTVFGVHARVADVRIGQRDELTAVRRVGEDLLIAGDGGVEHDLAHGAGACADGAAVKDRAVGKDQDGSVGCGRHLRMRMRKAGSFRHKALCAVLPASLSGGL